MWVFPLRKGSVCYWTWRLGRAAVLVLNQEEEIAVLVCSRSVANVDLSNSQVRRVISVSDLWNLPLPPSIFLSFKDYIRYIKSMFDENINLEINSVSVRKCRLLLSSFISNRRAASFVNSRRSWKAAKENRPFSVKCLQFSAIRRSPVLLFYY